MNFKTDLHLACKKGKGGDFDFIYFKDGFIYISNGTVHIKQSMALHGISPAYEKMLNKTRIHKKAFRLIRQQKEIEITHLNAPKSTFIGFNMGTSPFNMTLNNLKGWNNMFLDQIDILFNGWDMDAAKQVAFDPEGLEIIRKVFVSDTSGVTLRFNNKKQGILVTPNKDDYLEHAIIKPLKITGEKNEKL